MTGKPLKLTVLDLGYVPPGSQPEDVIKGCRELARLAESLGYHRYWLAEHHEAHYAWASPEIVMADVANHTKHIRIGSAAILLTLYSPLKVVENFKALARLHPGRIDLGVCAGVPLDSEILYGLIEDRTIQPKDLYPRYQGKLEALIEHLGKPEEGAAELWLQGSGMGNVILSAKHGTNFSYSLFHRGSKQDPALLKEYKNSFQRDRYYSQPQSNIAVSVICAENEHIAKRQKERVISFLGQDIFINIVGSPRQCSDEIRALAGRFETDEVIIHSLWDDHYAHMDSYQMLAEELELVDLACEV